MPWGNYGAKRRPEGVEPTYQTAIIGRVPLSRITVVQDSATLSHNDTIRRLTDYGLTEFTYIESVAY
jgi:hypothetical protein